MTIALSKNPVQHERTKHIGMLHHFIREKLEDNTITLNHVISAENLADMLTKGLPVDTFQRARHLMGLRVKSEQVGVSKPQVKLIRSFCHFRGFRPYLKSIPPILLFTPSSYSHSIPISKNKQSRNLLVNKSESRSKLWCMCNGPVACLSRFCLEIPW